MEWGFGFLLVSGGAAVLGLLVSMVGLLTVDSPVFNEALFKYAAAPLMAIAVGGFAGALISLVVVSLK